MAPQTFFTLCEKARLTSSLAKLKGAHAAYAWKAEILSHLISSFPEYVKVFSSEHGYLRLDLKGFGQIHCDLPSLSESAKAILEEQIYFNGGMYLAA